MPVIVPTLSVPAVVEVLAMPNIVAVADDVPPVTVWPTAKAAVSASNIRLLIASPQIGFISVPLNENA